jgi:hypothetical protein
LSTALNFLIQWVRECVNPTTLDDKPGAEYLACECMRDAKNAGVDEAALIAAARGDLVKYMLSRLNVAVRSHEVRSARSIEADGSGAEPG